MTVSLYRSLAAVLTIMAFLVAGLAAASPARPAPTPSQDQKSLQSATGEGSGEVTVDLADEDADGVWTGNAITNEGVNIVGATWTAALEADAPKDTDHSADEVPTSHAGHEAGSARYRTGTDGAWSTWQNMAVNATEVSTGTEGDVVIGPLDIQIEVDAQANDATLTVWTVPVESADAGALNRRADGSALSSKPGGADAAPSTQDVASPSLIIGTRAQWGAEESLRKWSPNYINGTEGVTIHHTAGSNNYSADQVPAILRGIYQYHAVTRDWGDVGYNILVDRFGRAWEGRRGGPEKSLRTAHASGMNYTTAGIALVGDYTTTQVPRAAFDALAQVTAWKLMTHRVSRYGTFTHDNDVEEWTRTLSTVHGHRDVNQTSCPGDRFYARMSEFRSKVRSYSTQANAMQRVSGPDRYATAAELAAAAHPFGADTVYITRGDDIIEALAVGAAAAHSSDALLLTRSTSLPSATAEQIRQLDPDEVIVVADSSRITSTVIAQIEAVTNAPVKRLRSADQYALAAGLSRQWSQAPVVYIASGQQPADALSGGAAAAHDDAPLLLSTDRNMPATTQQELARLQPKKVILLGGERRIPASAVNDVRRNVPGATVTRLAGTDRYKTSALVSGETFEGSSRAYLANGSASIDAAAGTQYAAATNSPILLISKSCRSSEVATTMDGMDTNLHVLLGGTGSLDDSSASAVCR